MWLMLFMMVVSYFTQDTSTPEKKRRALLNSALIGGATAYATTSTDWGKSLNADFNSAFGLDSSWTGFSADATAAADGQIATGTKTETAAAGTAVAAGAATAASSGSVFSSVPPWLLTAGAGAAAASLIDGDKILKIGAVALAGYVGLRALSSPQPQPVSIALKGE